jgi:hypothetical protein
MSVSGSVVFSIAQDVTQGSVSRQSFINGTFICKPGLLDGGVDSTLRPDETCQTQEDNVRPDCSYAHLCSPRACQQGGSVQAVIKRPLHHQHTRACFQQRYVLSALQAGSRRAVCSGANAAPVCTSGRMHALAASRHTCAAHAGSVIPRHTEHDQEWLHVPAVGRDNAELPHTYSIGVPNGWPGQQLLPQPRQ